MRQQLSPELQLLEAGKYLAVLALVEKEMKTAPAERKNLLGQKRAMYLALCGDEAGALAAWDAAFGGQTGKVSPPEPLPGARLRDARDEILKRAAKQQVVILNEAHHISRHRAFGLSLLPGLRRLGFTHFAAETFAPPKELQQSLARGFVTQKTGYYTKDPVFAAYVRTALELGFTPVAYEIEEGGREGASPEERINIRETAQANNLYERIFKKNPRARVLVHVGFNHVTRTPDVFEDEGKKTELLWMAGRLTRLLGAPLLTIDQTGGTEAGTPANESPILRGVLERRDLTRPSLVQKADGTFLKEGIGQDCDLTVFHPRMRLRKGRSDWLFSLPGRREVPLPSSVVASHQGRLLVQAFPDGAPEDAVPSDRFLLTADTPRPVLVLPRGRYRLTVQDEDGNTRDAGPLVA